ncbi:hypothetical protein LUZ60_005799 [Juncus effusus]|nr:hypothetical protein LUZ60_005799 [Juncus effusus]
MSILGLGHLGVKLKRDNGIGFPKAEFFDNLGNGLYLETDLDEFERLLDEILEISMVPDLDLEAINELKKGDLVKALELRDEALQLGQELSLVTISEILRGLCAKPVYVKYVATKRICEEAPESSNLDPSIKQFCKIGEIQTAINLVNKMIKSGIVPTSIGYNELVQKLSLNKELDQALDFYTEMRFKKIEPTEKSCETLIQNLCNLGRLSEAKLILEEMISAGTVPSYEMYNLVLEKYHEVKNLEKAAEITREMQKLGYNPKFETQWSIISDLSSFGDKLERDCTPILPLQKKACQQHFTINIYKYFTKRTANNNLTRSINS